MYTKIKTFLLYFFIILLFILAFFMEPIILYIKAKNDPLTSVDDDVVDEYNEKVMAYNDFKNNANKGQTALLLYTNDADTLSTDLIPNIEEDNSNRFYMMGHLKSEIARLNYYLLKKDSLGLSIIIKTKRTRFIQGLLQPKIQNSNSKDFVIVLDYKRKDREEKEIDSNRRFMALAIKKKQGEFETERIVISNNELMSENIDNITQLYLSTMWTNPDCKFYFTPMVHGGVSRHEFEIACQKLNSFFHSRNDVELDKFYLKEIKF